MSEVTQRRGRKILIGILVLVVAQFAVGLVFQVADQFVALDRPLFNLSYFLVPLALMVHRRLGLLVAFVLVVSDVVFHLNLGGMSTAAIYGLITLVPDAGMYGLSLLLAGLMLSALAVTVVYVSFARTDWSATALALLLIVALTYGGRLLQLPNAVTLGWPGFIGRHLLTDTTDPWFVERLLSISTKYESMTELSYSMKAYAGQPRKFVTVVVESFGYPRREHVLRRLEDRLRLRLGSRLGALEAIEFRGSTVNGEIRELCGLWMNGLVAVAIPDPDRCLPSVARSRRTPTAAFHNNTAGFYDRMVWYRQIGFDAFFDREEMMKRGAPSGSHAFDGVHDADVVPIIVAWASGRDAYLVHWMTLDAHGPYSAAGDGRKTLDDEVCRQLDVSNPLECTFWQLLDGTIDAIAALAEAMPDATIVVTGDHGPHFQDLAVPATVKAAHESFLPGRVVAVTIHPARPVAVPSGGRAGMDRARQADRAMSKVP